MEKPIEQRASRKLSFPLQEFGFRVEGFSDLRPRGFSKKGLVFSVYRRSG